jgi:hypothetical protein
MTDANKSFDMDSILDGTLDDLADVPEFKNFPNGAHTATIKFEKKAVNNHPCVEVKLIGIETQELTNPQDDKPIAKGDESSVLYMLDNELGQGKFKELMKPFLEVHGNKKLSELMSDAQNSEVLVVTTQRPNKDKTKLYMDISNLSVL